MPLVERDEQYNFIRIINHTIKKRQGERRTKTENGEDNRIVAHLPLTQTGLIQTDTGRENGRRFLLSDKGKSEGFGGSDQLPRAAGGSSLYQQRGKLGPDVTQPFGDLTRTITNVRTPDR